MPKRVLNVGQCRPDQAAIAGLLRQFKAEVVAVDDAAQTLAALERDRFDLVLVNRKLDVDYSDGIEIIRQLKADARFASVPVMLISNYSEHQAAAQAAGAEPGFGKAELNKPATREKLAAFLSVDV